MSAPIDRLERALQAFRHDQAAAYLRRLAGAPPEETRSQRARAFLCSEAASALVDQARASGEVAPPVHAA